MKCGKCGALISVSDSVCPGCNTPVTELEMNNLLVKENVDGVEVMPESPVVQDVPTVETPKEVVVNDVPPVETIVDVEPAPVVEVAVTSNDTPVVNVVPEEITIEPDPVVETAPVVESIPEVLPSETPVVESEPVTITPNSVPETPVVNTEVNVDTTPVIEPKSDDVKTESTLDNLSSVNPDTVVTATASEVLPSVSNEPVVTVNETPVADSEESTIINSVVSEVKTTDPVTPGSETSSTESPVEKTKKGGKIGLIIGGVVVVVLILVLCWYFLIFTKPANMFKTTISVFRTQLNKSLGDESKPSKVNLTLKTNLKTSNPQMQAIFDNLNKLSLKADVYGDMKNQVMQLDMAAAYKEKSLVDISVLYEKTLAYLKFNGLFDKYIAIELENNIFADEESNDTTVIVDGLLVAIEESLKNDYFTKVNKTATINGESVEVKANTLVINSGNINVIVTDIVENLKKNEAFVSALSKMNEVKNEDTVAQLNNFITATDTSKWSEEQKKAINYQVTLYTSGLMNTPVGVGYSDAIQSMDLYFNESSVVLYSKINDKEVKVMDVTLSGSEYTISLYSNEDVYSIILGYKIDENPSFTKPDVTNHVKFNEITENDQAAIMGGLMTSEGFGLFMQDFGEIINMIKAMFGPQIGMGGSMGEVTVPNVDTDYNATTPELPVLE